MIELVKRYNLFRINLELAITTNYTQVFGFIEKHHKLYSPFKCINVNIYIIIYKGVVNYFVQISAINIFLSRFVIVLTRHSIFAHMFKSSIQTNIYNFESDTCADTIPNMNHAASPRRQTWTKCMELRSDNFFFQERQS